METIDTTEKVTKDLISAGYKVAENKKNSHGNPQFHTRGAGNSVPDIFFWDEAYEEEIFNPKFIPNKRNHIRAGFIELKTGDHSGELWSGVIQNTRYYSYFITNKAFVSVNGKNIHNVDVFLLGTAWSRMGMIYKGDEGYLPKPIKFFSEKYNAVMMPCTKLIHSWQRKFQKMKNLELMNEKKQIARNKMNVETGIMISKIPFNENEKISYEYYAWIGNRFLPMLAKQNRQPELITTRVKVINETEKAIQIETKLQEQTWLPKSQIKSECLFEKDVWVNIRIPLWLYSKNGNIFGIA